MISVIVPVYRVEPFLCKCLDSILNQTYPDLEVILIDDGSNDNCPALCDKYAKKDSRVNVIHKRNEGQSSARNSGLNIAQGNFIGFVDSDDWIDANMYESLYDAILETGADVVTGGYRFYRPWKVENKILDGDYDGSVCMLNSIEALNMFYFGPQRFGGITNMVWTKLYRKDLLRNLRFCEGYNIGEDSEFTPRMLYKATKIAKLDKSLYTYNIHLGTDSTSGMKTTPYKIRSGVAMRRETAYFFQENYTEKVSEYTLSAYFSSLLNAYYECRIRRNKSPEFKNDAAKYLKTIRDNKREILKTNPNLKTRLFFVSPTIYCLAVWSKRTAKHLKYKLRVLVTGKN